MKIRNMQELKKCKEIVDQCARTVWIVTPSGEQIVLKNPAERYLSLDRMICMHEYE